MMESEKKRRAARVRGIGRVDTEKETVVDVGRYVVSVCCGGEVRCAMIVRGSREKRVESEGIVQI